MADHGGLLLLPVHAAIGAGGDDAAAVGGVRPEREGVASLAGLFYYGYSPFSLVAGVAWIGWDRQGRADRRRGGWRRRAAVRVRQSEAASVGRLLQGAGGVFALVGAAYIATTNFPASRAATLIGATQMFGMAGGSAGQFVVGPMIGGGRAWSSSGRRWASSAWRSARCSSCCCRRERRRSGATTGCREPAQRARRGLPQSAVDPLRHDRRPAVHPDDDLRHDLGRALPAGGARVRLRDGGAALVDGAGRLDHRLPAARVRLGSDRPPQAGDRRRRRRCCSRALAWILYGRADVFPPYVLGLVAGIASGAAMLPYTVIKEANPPEVSGTATGVVNFLNFTFSALLGRCSAGSCSRVSGGAAAMHARTLPDGVRAAAVRRGPRHRARRSS